MHIHKAFFGKELVDDLRGERPDAKHRVIGVRARPQVRDGAQVLKAVPLFLQRIGGIARADHLHGLGLQLKGLLHAGGERQRARGADGAAQRNFQRVGKASVFPSFQHDLQVFKARAVVDFDEAERL